MEPTTSEEPRTPVNLKPLGESLWLSSSSLPSSSASVSSGSHSPLDGSCFEDERRNVSTPLPSCDLDPQSLRRSNTSSELCRLSDWSKSRLPRSDMEPKRLLSESVFSSTSDCSPPRLSCTVSCLERLRKDSSSGPESSMLPLSGGPYTDCQRNHLLRSPNL